jgi:hypothetical protein
VRAMVRRAPAMQTPRALQSTQRQPPRMHTPVEVQEAGPSPVDLLCCTPTSDDMPTVTGAVAASVTASSMWWRG